MCLGGVINMKHMFHRNGKFVDLHSVNCSESFDNIEDQIACELEKQASQA
jgi:hypothetical protein